MERLTERIDSVPDEESDVWGKNHDYVSAAEKLAEYEDLEQQGRLVKLPCKVGDTVYIIIAKSISKQKVKEIIIDEYGIKFKTNRRMFGLRDVFHAVFLTREEAETKLKELGDNQNGKV